ncbi:hypothetical protein D3C72_1705790 [compost metagenome]
MPCRSRSRCADEASPESPSSGPADHPGRGASCSGTLEEIASEAGQKIVCLRVPRQQLSNGEPARRALWPATENHPGNKTKADITQAPRAFQRLLEKANVVNKVRARRTRFAVPLFFQSCHLPRRACAGDKPALPGVPMGEAAGGPMVMRCFCVSVPHASETEKEYGRPHHCAHGRRWHCY